MKVLSPHVYREPHSLQSSRWLIQMKEAMHNYLLPAGGGVVIVLGNNVTDGLYIACHRKIALSILYTFISRAFGSCLKGALRYHA